MGNNEKEHIRLKNLMICFRRETNQEIRLYVFFSFELLIFIRLRKDTGGNMDTNSKRRKFLKVNSKPNN